MRIAAPVVAIIGLVMIAAASLAGGRAGSLQPAPRATPDVVGMRLAAARSLLAPARVQVARVAWAPSGVVAAIRGYGYDGAHTSRTVLRLEVGE